MPTNSTTLRNLQADAWGTYYDGGSMEILTAGDAVIVALPLGGDAFSSASGGSVALSGSIFAPAAASGIAAKARLKTSGGTVGTDGLTVDTPATVAWATATAYVVGDKRLHGGRSFVCTENHTSDADTEPGAGPSWRDVWTAINITLDNTNIAQGQTVTINAFTFTVPAEVD